MNPVPALRLLALATLLTLGAGCMSHPSDTPPTGVNARPGSAAVSHGRSTVATPANGSTQR